MTGLYKKNLMLLEGLNPEGFKMLSGIFDKKMIIKPVMTRTGDMTLEIQTGERRVFLHSKYDPGKEAAQLVGRKALKPGDMVLVLGFGLGYHVAEVLRVIGDNAKVVVIEPNKEIFREALKYIDMEQFLTESRLKIILEEDIAQLSKLFSHWMDLVLEKEGQFIIHRASLELMSDYVKPLQELFLEWRVRQDTISRFESRLSDNFSQNVNSVKNLPRVSKLFDRFKGVPALLVAAGPSLDDSVRWLPSLRNRCLVICVGRALKSLLNFGLIPDLVVITDPQPSVYSSQLEGLDIGVPIVLLPTVHPNLMRNYSGAKLVAFQAGMNEAEEMAAVLGEQLVETGGSVSTTALDIIIRMGCSPVLFAGLDLAYIKGRSHSKDVGGIKVDSADGFRLVEVQGNQGGLTKAPLNLNIYRKWVERRIEKSHGKTIFYNLSPEGAVITGAPYLDSREAIDKLLTEDIGNQKKLLSEICLTKGRDEIESI